MSCIPLTLRQFSQETPSLRETGWESCTGFTCTETVNKSEFLFNHGCINCKLLKRCKHNTLSTLRTSCASCRTPYPPICKYFTMIFLFGFFHYYSNKSSTRWARPRTQHGYHHDTKVKPEAATAVIELLMMGGRRPETCWAVNKRQDNKLENCFIWLVIYLNCTIMHGLTNLKPSTTVFSSEFAIFTMTVVFIIKV
jgi:hypothetical protein